MEREPESTGDVGGGRRDGDPDAPELEEQADAIADFVEELLERMGIDAIAEPTTHRGHVYVDIVDGPDDDMALLIGRHGQTLDAIQERSTGLHVSATIHVEKLGQRAILVGRGGEKIKEIGTHARQRLSELTEQPVHLKLFVRVTERWRDMPRQLAEFGYTTSGS